MSIIISYVWGYRFLGHTCSPGAYFDGARYGRMTLNCGSPGSVVICVSWVVLHLHRDGGHLSPANANELEAYGWTSRIAAASCGRYHCGVARGDIVAVLPQRCANSGHSRDGFCIVVMPTSRSLAEASPVHPHSTIWPRQPVVFPFLTVLRCPRAQ